MKKLLLSLVLLAVLAAPSFAYVQSGHLLQGQQSTSDHQARAQHGSRWLDGEIGGSSNGIGINGVPLPTPPVGNPIGDDATRPIPEPGTMVLASLGLLALGVSRARRRGH
jgi:hypothetical protein